MKEYNRHFTVLFDRDEELYYCKVGPISEGIANSRTGSLPLHYTVWGKSAKECQQRARQLVTILHNKQTIDHSSLI